jgi:hypothetical protein
MIISPGSFPKNGIPVLRNRRSKPPIMAMIIPKIKRNFPIYCRPSDITLEKLKMLNSKS